MVIKMRKLLSIILVIVLLTGCSIQQTPKNFNQQVVSALKNNHRPNYVTQGYKLYLPFDVKVYNDKNNNLELYYQGKFLYMYTDLISFYYKYQEGYKYDVNVKAAYSKKLDYKDKLGYIEINKYKNKFFVQVMYNYAKIETVVYNKVEAYETALTSLRVLNSVVYKQKIVEALIDDKAILNSDEEIFQLFKPKQDKTDFIQYVEDYDKYNEEIILEDPVVDDDQIIINESEDTALMP